MLIRKGTAYGGRWVRRVSASGVRLQGLSATARVPVPCSTTGRNPRFIPRRLKAVHDAGSLDDVFLALTEPPTEPDTEPVNEKGNVP